VEFTLTTAHVEFSHSPTDLMFYKTGAARKSVRGYTTQAWDRKKGRRRGRPPGSCRCMAITLKLGWSLNFLFCYGKMEFKSFNALRW